MDKADNPVMGPKLSFDLEAQGMRHLGPAYWNLQMPFLYEHAVRKYRRSPRRYEQATAATRNTRKIMSGGTLLSNHSEHPGEDHMIDESHPSHSTNYIIKAFGLGTGIETVLVIVEGATGISPIGHSGLAQLGVVYGGVAAACNLRDGFQWVSHRFSEWRNPGPGNDGHSGEERGDDQ